MYHSPASSPKSCRGTPLVVSVAEPWRPRRQVSCLSSSLTNSGQVGRATARRSPLFSSCPPQPARKTYATKLPNRTLVLPQPVKPAGCDLGVPEEDQEAGWIPAPAFPRSEQHVLRTKLHDLTPSVGAGALTRVPPGVPPLEQKDAAEQAPVVAEQASPSVRLVSPGN